MMIITTFLLFIIFFTIGTFWLYKLKGFKMYNYLIFLLLVMIWFAESFFMNNLSNYKLNGWTLAIIVSLFYFTQVVTRVPLGILSNKLLSRVAILRIVITIFISALLVTLFTNKNWNIWLLTISAGLIASTYGLQNQYNAESWNIKKSFQSVGIVYITPIIGQLLSLFVIQVFDNWSIQIKYIWLFTFLLSTLTFLFLFFFNEKKETFILDNNVPKQLKYRFKKYELIILCLTIFVLAVGTNLITNKKILSYYSNINLLTNLIVTKIALFLSGLLTGSLLIKKFGVLKTKMIGYMLSLIGLTLFIIMLFTSINNNLMILIASLFMAIGYSILFLTLFAISLHADLKNPLLISGIFLSVNSLAFALSNFMSMTMFSNVSSKYSVMIILTSITVICLFSGIGLTYFTNKKIKYIFINPYEYEFQSKIEHWK